MVNEDADDPSAAESEVQYLDAIVRQATETHAILSHWCTGTDTTQASQTTVTHLLPPPCIFTAGGDCGVEVVPVSYAHLHWPGLVVVWLDAHADLNSPSTSPSAHFHGMPVRTLLGEGPAVLAPLLFTPHERPMTPGQFVFVGTRDIDPPEQEYIDRHQMTLIHQSGTDERSAGGRSLAQRLADALAAGRFDAAYIHIDLDVLDPSVFPCTCCPTAGGLSLATLLGCVRAVQQAVPHVVGCGLTECCGDPSSHSRNLAMVVDALVNAMERSPVTCHAEVCARCDDEVAVLAPTSASATATAVASAPVPSPAAALSIVKQ